MASSALEVHAELFGACALKCLHCSADNLVPTSDTAALSVVDQMVRLRGQRACQVFLTGGEPLMSQALSTAVKSLTRHGASVGILTSGCLADGDTIRSLRLTEARRLREAGLAAAYFSVYGDSDRVHDGITGCRGSLAAALTSMRVLRGEGVEIRFNVPLLAPVIAALPSIREFAWRQGATEIRLLRAVRHGRADVNWNQVGANVQAQHHAAAAFVEMSDGQLGDVRITIAGFPQGFACRPSTLVEGCPAGTAAFFVTLDGAIFPCASLKHRANAIGLSDAIRAIRGRATIDTVSHACLQDTAT